MKREVQHEDTPFGRRTFFSDIQLFHPEVPGDATGIALVRHEEMRYGVALMRGTWSTFFSAEEVLKIADFVLQHHRWLEWARACNYRGQESDPPEQYPDTTLGPASGAHRQNECINQRKKGRGEEQKAYGHQRNHSNGDC